LSTASAPRRPSATSSPAGASTGVKAAYPWLWSDTTRIVPFAGIYADYYFNTDDATVPFTNLPTEVLHGWSARVTSGVSMTFTGGARVSVDAELGGIGSDFKFWTARGRFALPF
jgi:hypothetical protein